MVQMLRVVQGRRSLRLALKTGERLRVAGDLIGQELESDKPVQPSVFGLVDHTHPTTPELLDNAVVRNGLVDH